MVVAMLPVSLAKVLIKMTVLIHVPKICTGRKASAKQIVATTLMKNNVQQFLKNAITAVLGVNLEVLLSVLSVITS